MPLIEGEAVLMKQVIASALATIKVGRSRFILRCPR